MFVTPALLDLGPLLGMVFPSLEYHEINKMTLRI